MMAGLIWRATFLTFVMMLQLETIHSENGNELDSLKRVSGLTPFKRQSPLTKRDLPPSWWYHTTGHSPGKRRNDNDSPSSTSTLSRQRSLSEQFIQDVLDFFSRNPLVEQSLLSRKRGPPPGWWYHTTGHSDQKRPRSMSNTFPQPEQPNFRITRNTLDDFIRFLQLKDDGRFDSCLANS